MDLLGIHHLTAVTANARENHRFYTRVLGMRLIKRSVNQDDVSAYHLFYGDAVGTPGCDLTFFDWDLPRERRGTRSIVRTHLRVGGESSVEWWAARLREEGIEAAEPEERDGRLTLDFEDPEGQRLSFVDDGGRGDEPTPWKESPVPAEHQVRGLGPVVLSVPMLHPTDTVLEGVMSMRRVREYADPIHGEATVHVFEMGGHAAGGHAAGGHAAGDHVGGDHAAGGTPPSRGDHAAGDHVGRGTPPSRGAHAELHVAVQPGLPAARLGAGGVHHVAFRTPDEESYDAWADHLNRLGVGNSGKIDRFYFRSLYFHEPNGVLFEIATDGPGFAVDEDVEELGREVALPPFLEPRREEIVAALEPIE